MSDSTLQFTFKKIVFSIVVFWCSIKDLLTNSFHIFIRLDLLHYLNKTAWESRLDAETEFSSVPLKPDISRDP
jgi:hypothetical protein